MAKEYKPTSAKRLLELFPKFQREVIALAPVFEKAEKEGADSQIDDSLLSRAEALNELHKEMVAEMDAFLAALKLVTNWTDTAPVAIWFKAFRVGMSTEEHIAAMREERAKRKRELVGGA